MGCPPFFQNSKRIRGMRFNGNLPIDQRSLMDLILSACEVRSIRRTTRSSLRVKLTSHGSKLESFWLEGCYQRHQHGAPFWALSLSWCGEPFILMFRSNPPTEGGGERKKLTRQNHHPQMGRPFCTSRRSRLSSGIIAVQRPLAPFSWRSLSYTGRFCATRSCVNGQFRAPPSLGGLDLKRG